MKQRANFSQPCRRTLPNHGAFTVSVNDGNDHGKVWNYTHVILQQKVCYVTQVGGRLNVSCSTSYQEHTQTSGSMSRGHAHLTPETLHAIGANGIATLLT